MKKIALFLAIVTILTSALACFGSFADDKIVNVFDKSKITRARAKGDKPSVLALF